MVKTPKKAYYRWVNALFSAKLPIGRFYKFNLSLANSQNLIKATANVILLSQI